ncbi:hypothetical protein GGR57DRAFT_502787 [Xylariaceae sp. FL1272]|nr:hypothetical protein GGR57DRAFT_502787 [Xylariaceae sp. FL1272]
MATSQDLSARFARGNGKWPTVEYRYPYRFDRSSLRDGLIARTNPAEREIAHKLCMHLRKELEARRAYLQRQFPHRQSEIEGILQAYDRMNGFELQLHIEDLLRDENRFGYRGMAEGKRLWLTVYNEHYKSERAVFVQVCDHIVNTSGIDREAARRTLEETIPILAPFARDQGSVQGPFDMLCEDLQMVLFTPPRSYKIHVR